MECIVNLYLNLHIMQKLLLYTLWVSIHFHIFTNCYRRFWNFSTKSFKFRRISIFGLPASCLVEKTISQMYWFRDFRLRWVLVNLQFQSTYRRISAILVCKFSNQSHPVTRLSASPVKVIDFLDFRRGSCFSNQFQIAYILFWLLGAGMIDNQ